MTPPKKRFVVVTTVHKGVFGGYLTAPNADGTLTLTEAQMCVYWSADIGGILGLAAGGPSKSCRISPPVPRLTLTDITSVMDATEGAEKAWKGRPWA